MTPIRSLVATALAASVLAACGNVSLWPFGESGPTETSQLPANATEYRCDGGKRFFVRPLDARAVWLIAPDRQIRLEGIGADGARYGVGRVLLEFAGDGASLTDPPATFENCKRPAAKS